MPARAVKLPARKGGIFTASTHRAIVPSSHLVSVGTMTRWRDGSIPGFRPAFHSNNLTSDSTFLASHSIGTTRMWWRAGLNIAVVGLLILLWYSLCLRWNRRRGRRLLSNIENTFSAYGYVCGVRWQSASQFQVRLRLTACAFTNSTVTVRMYPLQRPLGWIVSRLRRQRETFTFDANLLCPPQFNLEIRNQRRVAKLKPAKPGAKLKRKRRFLKSSAYAKGSGVQFHRLGPFILTSRRDWQRDIANSVQSLANTRDSELLSVSFHRNAPHFSATMPLSALAGLSISRERLFDSLRDLASSASAARR